MRTIAVGASCSLLAVLSGCGGTTNNSFYLGVYVPDGGTTATTSAASSATAGSSAATSSGGATSSGTSGVTSSGTSSSSGGMLLPDGGTEDGAANAYLDGLPGWPSPQPSYNGPVDGGDAGPGNYVTGTNDVEYVCSTTEYSLTSTPTQVVTFDPNVDVLWPGALLQGGPFQQGILSGLPITQRAPLTVSIPTLLSADNSQVVDQPNVATVQNAVGAIVAAAVDSGVQASSSVSYTQTSAYSASQVALDLGFSVSFVGGDLSSQLNLSESANLNTVVGYFVQNMFTVTVPEPESPGDLFSGLTMNILDPLISAGDVGPTNLPIYVASVTYGRIMIFSISSEQSTEQISAALSAQYHGVFASGSVSAQYSALLSDSSTTFSVVTVGGSASNAEALIETGDPSQFFTSDPPISTGVPISYVVRNLSDNSIAGVSQTTSYAVQTCDATTEGPGANIYISDNVAQVVRAYDFNGNPVALNATVQADNGYAFYGGLAYDSQDDRLFVVEGPLYSGTPPLTPSKILAFQPDGTPLSSDSFTAPALPIDSTFTNPDPGIGSISYDPVYDRLWMSQVNPGDLYSYTPAGELNAGLLGGGSNRPTAVLYVPTVDQLLVFSESGTQAFTFGTWAGVNLSASLTSLNSNAAMYDPTDDLLFIVPQSADTTIDIYTPQGTLVKTIQANGLVQSLAYDKVNGRILAALNDATVWAYGPDGASLPLPNGAFTNFAAPTGIVVRP